LAARKKWGPEVGLKNLPGRSDHQVPKVGYVPNEGRCIRRGKKRGKQKAAGQEKKNRRSCAWKKNMETKHDEKQGMGDLLGGARVQIRGPGKGVRLEAGQTEKR